MAIIKGNNKYKLIVISFLIIVLLVSFLLLPYLIYIYEIINREQEYYINFQAYNLKPDSTIRYDYILLFDNTTHDIKSSERFTKILENDKIYDFQISSNNFTFFGLNNSFKGNLVLQLDGPMLFLNIVETDLMNYSIYELKESINVYGYRIRLNGLDGSIDLLINLFKKI